MAARTRARTGTKAGAKKADARARPVPYEYEEMNEVPQPWRSLRGGALNLPQVNQIMARAYELGDYGGPEGDQFIPDLGHARDEFIAVHTVENGLWVPKAKG